MIFYERVQIKIGTNLKFIYLNHSIEQYIIQYTVWSVVNLRYTEGNISTIRI